jgi:hypothetical protein
MCLKTKAIYITGRIWLRMFKKMVLRTVFGSQEELSGSWREQNYEYLRNLTFHKINQRGLGGQRIQHSWEIKEMRTEF